MGAALVAGLPRPADADPAWRPQWADRFQRGLAAWPGLGPVWGQANHSLLDEAGVPGRILRVALHAGSIDPGTMSRRGLPRSGTGFKARILPALAGVGAEAARLAYSVRFAPGFDFVRGGKLPGLFGGSGPSGGRIPDGHDGFSLRLMWRERGAGEVYAYLPDSIVHGSSLLRGSWQFEPGRWHRVVQSVALNTPGRHDGWLTMEIDGRPVGLVHGLRLRDGAGLKADGVFFDLFFGGSDDSWAARADTHVDFADFALAVASAGAR
jgi:hypothetical protein